ncbi:MAG TPA: hypothetical protein VEA38_20810, partial [Terriglobales bacterium]|nr:hypothetical protein [Terriglobales bacterium]
MDRDHVKLASILDALRTYDRTTTFENWSKNFDALLRPFLTSAPQADDDLAMRFATAETELHRAEKQIAVLRAQVTVLVRTLELVKDCCAPGALAKEQQPTLRWEHAERVLADLSGAAKAHEDTVRREIEQEYLAEQAALVEALRSTIFRHLDSTVHRQVVHFDHEPPCSVCRVLS